MHYELTKYNYVILDYTAMFVRLESDLVKQLTSCDRVIFAPTAKAECENFAAIVPARLKRIYEENRILLPYRQERIPTRYGTVDTFGLAKGLARNGTKVLVVEANLALEDQLVFSSLSLDVYSWDKEQILTPDDFRLERSRRMLCKDSDPLPYDQIPPESAVYSPSRKHILSPENPDRQGGEAMICDLRNEPKHLAKLFKLDHEDKNVLTKQKLQNIEDLRDLGEDWDIQWLALPREILYADPGHTRPVGYLMDRVGGVFMSEDPLFAVGDPSRRFAEDPDLRVGDMLDLCIRFVSQYQFLAANGISLTDYNYKNFSMGRPRGNRCINMVDTDSFSYDDYLSKCITYGGCFSREYTSNTKYDLNCISDESLYIFIFTMLTLDQDYKPLFNGSFRFTPQMIQKYSEKPNMQIHLIKWESIPHNLQQLYADVFVGKRSPSVGILLHELNVARYGALALNRYVDLYAPLIKKAATAPKPPAEERSGSTTGTNPAPPAAKTPPDANTSTDTKTSTTTKTPTAPETHDADKKKKKEKKPLWKWLRGLALLLLLARLFTAAGCYVEYLEQGGMGGQIISYMAECFLYHVHSESGVPLYEVLAFIFS